MIRVGSTRPSKGQLDLELRGAQRLHVLPAAIWHCPVEVRGWPGRSAAAEAQDVTVTP
ncbi:MAG: hypothetical protein ACRDTU_14170 [Micromonosporaceae bacterium]